MSDFSARGQPNEIERGKRPMSSMVPTIVVDTKTSIPILVLGGAGHTRITTGVAQVDAGSLRAQYDSQCRCRTVPNTRNENAFQIALRHLYLGTNVKQAIDSPRLHHQLTPNTLHYQEGFPGILRHELASRGHTVSSGTLSSDTNCVTSIKREF